MMALDTYDQEGLFSTTSPMDKGKFPVTRIIQSKNKKVLGMTA